MDNEELLFNEIYDKTQDCGRTQFVRLLMAKERENQELKAKIKTYEDPEDLTLMFMYCDEKAKDKIKELNNQLEEKEKKYIPGEYAKKEYTKTFDENILLKNQQKEFIEYLRNLSNWYDADGLKQGIVNEILIKYKETIGVSDD